MNLAGLLRSYAALSPTNPQQIQSPPFPPQAWLAKHQNQAELFSLLVENNQTLANEGRRWKVAFWKRVINAIEQAYQADQKLKEEEEIEEKILTHYISLQQPSSSLPQQIPATEIHTYYYGDPSDRDSWSHISLDENTASISQGTTGLRTWGASVCLANYLILNRHLLLPDRLAVLELGSGTGLVGIVAHQLNPSNRVYLSDSNPDVLTRLRSNVRLNARQRNELESLISVQHLDWNDPPSSPIIDPGASTLVVGADVIYDPDLIPGLVRTIKQNLHGPSVDQQTNQASGAVEGAGQTTHTALICGIVRAASTWETFIATCHQQGLQVQFVDVQPSVDLARPASAGIVFPQALDPAASHTHHDLKLVRLTAESL